MWSLRWVLVLAVSLTLCSGVFSQVSPRVVDRSFQRPSARALGLGGAYLLLTDDASAVLWNPAALAHTKRFTFPIDLTGRANFDVLDVPDLVDSLEAIRDQTDVADAAAVRAAIRSAYEEVKRFAAEHPRMRASLTPVTGLSWGGYGLAVTTGVVLQLDTAVNAADPFRVGALPVADNLYFRGGAIAVTSAAVGYGHVFPAGLTLGGSIRWVRADFAGFLAGASLDPAAADPVLGTDFPQVNENAFTLDVGAIYEPPIQPPQWRIRYAGVVRNLWPAELDLGVVRGIDMSFRLNPEVDLGAVAEWKGGRTLGVLELHNVTGANGGDLSIHAGIEHWMGSVFAVRVGWDDDKPVLGLGVDLGVLRLDLAAGLKPQERLAVGLSLRF
ncbi:MAG: hypothetical protein NZ959_02790 [Armatimonadetes bacterium]|nr:hypothetical protein [Armatimonadota bacterium]MDW8121494.1 hypothetical protein [Armatimonadota bacterium]